MCPIYGFSAIILIYGFSKFKNKAIVLFTLSAAVFSAFEYVTSFFLEVAFNTKYWDYNDTFLNLNGRISLPYSILWGIAAIIFLDRLHPFICKKLNKTSLNIQKCFVYIGISLVIIDEIISITMKYIY